MRWGDWSRAWCSPAKKSTGEELSANEIGRRDGHSICVSYSRIITFESARSHRIHRVPFISPPPYGRCFFVHRRLITRRFDSFFRSSSSSSSFAFLSTLYPLVSPWWSLLSFVVSFVLSPDFSFPRYFFSFSYPYASAKRKKLLATLWSIVRGSNSFLPAQINIKLKNDRSNALSYQPLINVRWNFIGISFVSLASLFMPPICSWLIQRYVNDRLRWIRRVCYRYWREGARYLVTSRSIDTILIWQISMK